MTKGFKDHIYHKCYLTWPFLKFEHLPTYRLYPWISLPFFLFSSSIASGPLYVIQILNRVNRVFVRDLCLCFPCELLLIHAPCKKHWKFEDGSLLQQWRETKQCLCHHPSKMTQKVLEPMRKIKVPVSWMLWWVHLQLSFIGRKTFLL